MSPDFRPRTLRQFLSRLLEDRLPHVGVLLLVGDDLLHHQAGGGVPRLVGQLDDRLVEIDRLVLPRPVQWWCRYCRMAPISSSRTLFNASMMRGFPFMACLRRFDDWAFDQAHRVFFGGRE